MISERKTILFIVMFIVAYWGMTLMGVEIQSALRFGGSDRNYMVEVEAASEDIVKFNDDDDEDVVVAAMIVKGDSGGFFIEGKLKDVMPYLPIPLENEGEDVGSLAKDGSDNEYEEEIEIFTLSK